MSVSDKSGESAQLWLALLSGALALTAWLAHQFTPLPDLAVLGLYAASGVCGAFFTVQEAWTSLRKGRFDIDLLMLVAAAGAAALGKWGEGALLLFLFSLGHALEHHAMGRARRAIEALSALAPETAWVMQGQSLVAVGIGTLSPGDVVTVKPNERMPVDGVVLRGQSHVNQAPVTGESLPVAKSPAEQAASNWQRFERLPAQHRVFAGTINGAGVLEVVVARRSTESAMARVMTLVTEAQSQQSPTQSFTQRFERVFVPAVLLFTLMLMGACLVLDEPFSASFYRAMAVLVAASPCALAISVPSAVLSGIARAARGGVLIKGGAPLENLGTLTAMAFDKTGTLTEGQPRLVDVVAADGVSEHELLSAAWQVERQSDHPLAQAIVRGAVQRLGPLLPGHLTDVTSITGLGVEARLGGERLRIGKLNLFTQAGDAVPAQVEAANAQLMAQGRTTMLVCLGTRFLGVMGVMDTPRAGVPEVMQRLRGLGMTKLVMLSGDNPVVARAVGQAVGLTDALGDLMPDQKVAQIRQLAQQSGLVAMVGDGVNDAPAMASATVGIAMGAAGSDVALETADVALMADDLSKLPFAVGLSRATSRIIVQNLWLSLGMVAVLIPATLFGLNMGAAVVLHEGSTLLVVLNALRLLAYRE